MADYLGFTSGVIFLKKVRRWVRKVKNNFAMMKIQRLVSLTTDERSMEDA